MPILLVAADYFEAADQEPKVLDLTLEDLLPYSFGPEHLELPRGTA